MDYLRTVLDKRGRLLDFRMVEGPSGEMLDDRRWYLSSSMTDVYYREVYDLRRTRVEVYDQDGERVDVFEGPRKAETVLLLRRLGYRRDGDEGELYLDTPAGR